MPGRRGHSLGFTPPLSSAPRRVCRGFIVFPFGSRAGTGAGDCPALLLRRSPAPTPQTKLRPRAGVRTCGPEGVAAVRADTFLLSSGFLEGPRARSSPPLRGKPVLAAAASLPPPPRLTMRGDSLRPGLARSRRARGSCECGPDPGDAPRCLQVHLCHQGFFVVFVLALNFPNRSLRKRGKR